MGVGGCWVWVCVGGCVGVCVCKAMYYMCGSLLILQRTLTLWQKEVEGVKTTWSKATTAPPSPPTLPYLSPLPPFLALTPFSNAMCKLYSIIYSSTGYYMYVYTMTIT